MFKCLKISNFRAAVNLDVPLATGERSITYAVGPNNSGKTTLFRAVSLFEQPVEQAISSFDLYDGRTASFSLEHINGQTYSRATLGHHGVLGPVIPEFGSAGRLVVITHRRDWQSQFQADPMDSNAYYQNRRSTERGGQADQYIGARYARLIADGKEDEFLSKIKPYFADDVIFRITRNRAQSEFEHRGYAARWHPADQIGSGLMNLVRIALALFDLQPQGTIFIDEPEIGLHPQIQRKLARLLLDESRDKQIVVATHSPHIISTEAFGNGGQLTKFAMDPAHGIRAYTVQPSVWEQIKKIEADYQKPQIFDVLAKEIFFADSVVLLEGQEDVGLVRANAAEHGVSIDSVFGYGAAGADNISAFAALARDLGIPFGAVYDGGKSAQADKLRAMFPDAPIRVLSVPDIRDKYARDSKGRETIELLQSGMFDRKGRLKPEYLGEFKEKFSFC